MRQDLDGMTDTQEKILGVFKERKIDKDGALMRQSLNMQSWDRHSQDELPVAIKQLIDDEYISFNGFSYILREKGFEFIYEGPSLEATEELILNEFKKHEIAVDGSLMINSLAPLRNRAEKLLQLDKYTKAINNLLGKGLIKDGNNCFILTKNGHDRIY